MTGDQCVECTRRPLRGFDLCRQHKCKSKACNSKHVESLSYCENHRCYYPRCNKPHRSRTWACSSHKCKLAECNSIRATGRQHCEAHKCGKDTCHRARKLGGAAACESHTCRLRDANGNTICPNLVQQTPGSNSCFDHACGSDGCRRPYISIDIPYCRDHRCQWTITPCPQVAETPSRFCEQHKCPVRACKRSCRSAGMYCDDHRCRHDDGDCPQENSWWQNSWYCPNHTCSVAGCIQATLADAFQCDAHTCVWAEEGVRCDVEVTYSGDMCSEHCCIEQDCYNPRNGEGGYCAQHVCVTDGCYERRAISGKYCEYHKAEYQTQTAVVTTDPPRRVTRSRPTQNKIHDYGTAFLDGYKHGLSVQPGDREYAQRGMEQWGINSGHNRERAQMQQGMQDVANLVTQRQMQGDDVAASFWGQTRLIEEVGEEQTLGDLIPGVNSLDLNKDNREGNTASDRVVELS